jgi:hypothetical protein
MRERLFTELIVVWAAIAFVCGGIVTIHAHSATASLTGTVFDQNQAASREHHDLT